MKILRKLINNFSLSFKSLQNRLKRHSLEGTEKQINNIKSSINKYPRLYSRDREKVFDKSVKNRLVNN